MCAKREHREVYQPVADLHENDDVTYNLHDLPFIGTVAFFGLLENV